MFKIPNGLFRQCFIVYVQFTAVRNISTVVPSHDFNFLEQAIQKNDFSTPPWRTTGKQTTVGLHIYFSQHRNMGSNELEFMYYLYQGWVDERLKFNSTSDGNVVVRQKMWDKIWQPDLYIENELYSKIHNIAHTNKFLWVFPSGLVALGLRMSTAIKCKLGSVQFPVGHLQCSLRFRTYSNFKSVLALQWKKSGTHVEISSNFEQDNMHLDKYATKDCSNDRTSIVWNSCAEITLYLTQDYSGSLLRVYLPSVFIVIMAWLSFWIRREQVAARTSLGTLCVVSMITEKMGVNILLPETTSVSAVEVWLSVCLAFVCGALCEFIWVHVLTENRRKKEKKGLINPHQVKEETSPNLRSAFRHCLAGPKVSSSNNSVGTINISSSTKSRAYLCCCTILQPGKVEKWARIVYVLLFLMFQLFYWTFFMLVEQVANEG